MEEQITTLDPRIEGSIREVLYLADNIYRWPDFKPKQFNKDEYVIKRSKNSIKKIYKNATDIFSQVKAVKPILNRITTRFNSIYKELTDDTVTFDDMSQKIINTLYSKQINNIDLELREDERLTNISKQKVKSILTSISNLKSQQKRLLDEATSDSSHNQDEIDMLNQSIKLLNRELMFVKLDYVTNRLNYCMRLLLYYEIRYYINTKLYNSNHNFQITLINRLPLLSDQYRIEYDVFNLRRIFLFSLAITYKKALTVSKLKEIIPSMLFYQKEVVRYTDKQKILYTRCLTL